MSIIIKAFVKSLVQKKARTLLILFSISVSAAMIFANESFARTVTQRLLEAGIRWTGMADLRIQSKASVGSKEWLDPAHLPAAGSVYEYVHQVIMEKALYIPAADKMHYFNLLGVEIEEYNLQNPVSLSAGDFQNWDGFKVIIGRTFADIYHLSVNDVMRLELNNTAYEFKIAGISDPKGLFLRELADGGFILAPRKTLAAIFGGESNLVFLKLKDRSQLESVKAQLTQQFTDYQVEYGINETVIASETQNYVMPFRMASIVVVFMCVFIIFTAFNLITLERIPIVGTLRSIGSTRKAINAILIAESAVLGAVGGLAGCVLGIGVLQYIKYRYFTGEDAVANSTVLFGVQEVLVAVGAAVVITALSAVLPILSLTRTPIKNIILNDLAKNRSKPSRWWVAGVALLAACLLVPPFLGSSFSSMIIAGLLATGALLGLVPLVPFLTYHLSRLVASIPFLSQEVILGVRNVRDNKSLMNNIQLFSAAIAIVAFMASMFNTMVSDLVKSYERNMNYDLTLVVRHSDPKTLASLANTEGIASYKGVYLKSAEILNYQSFFNMLHGIDGPDFFQYVDVGGLEDNRSALQNLNNGKNIVTTNVMKGKLGLKLGDTLLLRFGGKEIPYTITGFVETNLGVGHSAFISAENFRSDMGVADYDWIYIKTNAPSEAVKSNLVRSLGKEVISLQTEADWLAANADKVASVFNAISSYSYLALLVGIIGVVNNLVASFIERKRSFAMLRCVGMSKKSLNRMLITEAVAMGVFGVVFGLLCAMVMSVAIPAAVSVLWGKVTVQIAVQEMALMGVVGVLAMLGISVVPVTSSDKLSLIQTIKYE